MFTSRWYASSKKPKVLLDIATLTGAIVVALGAPATGVYTNTYRLWNTLEKAGLNTNDYVWRMPLFKDQYMKQLKSNVAHINNIGGKEGGSATAATFLSEFVDFTQVKEV